MKFLGGIFLIFFLASCSPASQGTFSDPLEGWPHKEEGKSGKPPPLSLPKEVEASLLPPLSPPPGKGQKASQQLVSIGVNKVPLRTFFMGLAAESDINVMVHPDVVGDITLDLKQVTIADAIQAACKMNELSCQVTPAGFMVFPNRLEIRQFHVDYLRMQRTGTSVTQVSSGQTTTSTSSSSSGLPGGQNNTTSASQVSGSQVTTTSQSHFWNELVSSLCGIMGIGVTSQQPEGGAASPMGGLLSGGRNPTGGENQQLGCMEVIPQQGNPATQGRRVVVNPSTGTVMVRGSAMELDEIDHFLKRQERELDRQVILESKILEVELAEGSQTGINWSALINGSIRIGQTGGGTVFGPSAVNPIFNPNSSGVMAPSNTSGLRGEMVQWGVNENTPLGVNNLPISSAGGVFSIASSSHGFDSFIELLQAQGKVQILSSPRVTTMNNQKAVIRVGQDEMFVTNVEFQARTTATGGSADPIAIPKFTTFFSGIALDITPQIGDNNTVRLHVHPSVSEVSTDTKLISLGNQSQSYPLALSRIREADTIVRANNGEVVVIGGLMKETQTGRDQGLPIMGQLPGLGGLFRHSQESQRKSELVILIRPQVVMNGANWQNDVQEIRQRITGMNPARPQWLQPGTASGSGVP
ncbi:MAG: pilus (MSHA type) biogenesis protein MshL [Magnetococcales bacterium]|nr:pilus (MSHA type) biogenesis protein MshL [Magnetococcales bacterium]NGZ28023.1 pilus (MSHA type) biogenesis protein MshL [Magnetococcales bacterium]